MKSSRPVWEWVWAQSTELHYVTKCQLISTKRQKMYDEISQIIEKFFSLTDEERFSTLMCPVSAKECKIINKFLKHTFQEFTLRI